MAFDLSTQRQEAHILLDTLPDAKLAAVRTLLDVLADPLELLLATAPHAEEELSDAAIAAFERGRRDSERGDTTSQDQGGPPP